MGVYSWPKAILHIDGDSFFASCEQAIHPEYRGKPVITGRERGIAASFSIEAKKRGVTRAMMLSDIKKICPDAIIVPSDYETYSLFSRRMFAIVKKYTPFFEEYSIDEGFADLTGLRRPLNMSYEQIAANIKKEIETSLEISVSVGLSVNKSLAKLASDYKKPNGLVIVSGRDIELFLSTIPLADIWGIGPNTTAYLLKLGMTTAGDFAKKDKTFVEKYLHKPGIEIWEELNGQYIFKVDDKEKDSYQSISKVKTFTPPSRNRNFIYAQLIKNLEGACIKARRFNLAASKIIIMLKTQQFHSKAVEIKLERPSAYEIEIAPHVKIAYDTLFNPQLLYRQTGVVLASLAENNKTQYSLFEDPLRASKIEAVVATIDELDYRYGKYTVIVGSSLFAHVIPRHGGKRGQMTERQQITLSGETKRQRLKVPYFFAKV